MKATAAAVMPTIRLVRLVLAVAGMAQFLLANSVGTQKKVADKSVGPR